MNKRYLFIILSSFTLFSFQSKKLHLFNNSFIQHKSNKLHLNKKCNTSDCKLQKAFITGNKKGLNRGIKKAYKRLHLNHLFTPSGVHLMPILFLLKIYLKPLALCIITLGLFFIFQSTNALFSLERITIIKFYYQFSKFIKLKISNPAIYFTSFITSFLIGNFSKSPLSFCYSYLFLGSIFSSRKFFEVIKLFYFSNIFISFIDCQEINIFSPLFGNFLTLFFTILYPLILISFALSLTFKIDLNIFTALFNEIVVFVSTHIPDISFKADLFLIFFAGILLFKQKSCVYLLILPNQFSVNEIERLSKTFYI